MAASSDIRITSLEALFRVEQDPMVRLATLMLGSRSIAEEVVQDAFSIVGQRWDDIERPGGYLRKVVVNRCRSVLRRRQVVERYDALEIAPVDPMLPTHLVELAEALERLGERQRAVIVLRYFIDLPDQDIAEIIDAKPATVRSVAHRALRVLRRELS